MLLVTCMTSMDAAHVLRLQMEGCLRLHKLLAPDNSYDMSLMHDCRRGLWIALPLVLVALAAAGGVVGKKLYDEKQKK